MLQQQKRGSQSNSTFEFFIAAVRKITKEITKIEEMPGVSVKHRGQVFILDKFDENSSDKIPAGFYITRLCRLNLIQLRPLDYMIKSLRDFI